MSTAGSARAAKLLGRLCERLSGCNADQVPQLVQYALRILGSHITPTVVEDELYVVQRIKKKLAREGKTAEAANVAELYRRLQDQPIVRRRWSVLLLLFSISVDAPAAASQFRKPIGEKSVLFQPKAAGLEAVDPPDALLSAEQPSRGASGPQQTHNQQQEQERRCALIAQLRAKNIEHEHGRTAEEVPQHVIVRDLVYVLQGIDGRLVRFDPAADAYLVDRQAGVPQPTRDLVSKIAELGWLFKQVQMYVATHAPEDAGFGLVAQAFCGALKAELAEYFRLLAVLEGQAFAEDPGPKATALTLRRLAVWTQDPLMRMRLLAAMGHVCNGMKGGALCSTLHSFSRQGDPYVTALVKHVTERAFAPMSAILRRWLFEGELDDPYREFFIAADTAVEEDQLWTHKYSLRPGMLPSFISDDLSRKILLIGKSINFIRHACQDRGRIVGLTHALADGLNFGELDAWGEVIDKISTVTSSRLLELLARKYELMKHLDAIRRYLLLGQGDFADCLMRQLSTDLERPAQSLYLHSLTAVLEQCVRKTNAQYDDADILQRLDVKLLEAQPGDRGWDVFSLMYSVDRPLSTIITSEATLDYLMIFNFFWRTKRVNFVLTSCWSNQIKHSRQYAELLQLRWALHHCHALGAEMTHFVKQIQHYFVFEVLECAWDTLVRRLRKAGDLDHVIAAHNEFLLEVKDGALLSQSSTALLSQLRSIFDLVISYKMHQDAIYGAAATELERRSHYEHRARGRSEQGGWGVDDETAVQHTLGEARFEQEIVPDLEARLRTDSRTYRDMVANFLVMLTQQENQDLRFLSTRLDFNEHYRRLMPSVAQAVSPYQAKTTSRVSSAGLPRGQFLFPPNP
eukprot:m.486294 g.486294  ORF g.486294 m.486294 type:complete len:857 (+) comp24292_c0_seq1:160-2730(+)